jgi:hypothetical protein
MALKTRVHCLAVGTAFARSVIIDYCLSFRTIRPGDTVVVSITNISDGTIVTSLGKNIKILDGFAFCGTIGTGIIVGIGGILKG